MFDAIAAGAVAPDRDFRRFNAVLAKAPPRRTLAPTEQGYGWASAAERVSASAVLAPVLWSAADLLVGSGHNRIRCCANRECLWLFLDRSKSATRRWCDMGSCGNRAKARRHYDKVRRAEPLRVYS